MLTNHELKRAIDLLKQGELIGLPTETVYGLAADASNPNAVEKIFKAKGRPANHSVIVHISSIEQVTDWVTTIPESAKKLAAEFWPGPLTMVFQKKSQVNTVVTGGKDTIALRSPNHPIAQQVLKAFDGGLAAPSANRFCHISPTQARDVEQELADKVAYVIEGGACKVGIESTIVDVTQTPPVILRPGMINAQMLSDCLGETIRYAAKDTSQTPGNLKKHYAPDTTVYLISNEELSALASETKNIGVISLQQKPTNFNGLWLHVKNDATNYAHNLYHYLRELDNKNLQAIIIERPPLEDEWHAIHDRLQRLATAKSTP